MSNRSFPNNDLITLTWKTYQVTYNNSLKTYINSLEKITDISAITYGIEIPVDYQSDVLKALLMQQQ